MSKEMRKQINKVKNYKKFLNNLNGKFDDLINKLEKTNKESCFKTILNRDNLMLNKYDRIVWDDDFLKIGISYFYYGQKFYHFLKVSSLIIGLISKIKNYMIKIC